MQSTASMWFLLVLPIALAVVQPLEAQFPREIAPRTRVRIQRLDGEWIYGQVTRVAVDTLYVLPENGGTPEAIPRATIQRIDRSLGNRTLTTCTRAGQVVGGVLTLALLVIGFTSDAFETAGAWAIGIGTWAGIINLASYSECWRHVALR